MEEWIWVLIGFVVGSIVGWVIEALAKKEKPVGTIRVVDDEEGPYLFLEMDHGGLDRILDSDKVVMRVNAK